MRALLYALLLLLALVTLTSAQDDATTTAAATAGNNDATTTNTAEATTTTAATTASETTASEESSVTSESASNTESATRSESAASTTAAATTSDDASSTTSSASSTRSSATTTLGNTASSRSALPTLAGAGIPTVIVPDLSRAPFMQKSSYPEGTVFICVGAILGFFGFCLLAWRAMIAYSLHRSVKKAALAQSMSDSKTMRGPGSTYGPGGGVYNAVGHGSTLSLDHLKSPNGPKSPLEKTRLAPSQSSLFFSPTADNPNRVSHYSLSGNRSSTYLPAGYYAAGNSTLSPTANNFGNPRTRSMYSQNYGGPSPPESPSLPPNSRDGPTHVPHSPLGDRHPSGSYYPRPPGSRGNDSSAGARSSVAGTVAGGHSTSTLNLNAPPQGRTPSAYLEDLFENGTDLPGPGPDHYTPRRGRRESGSRI